MTDSNPELTKKQIEGLKQLQALLRAKNVSSDVTQKGPEQTEETRKSGSGSFSRFLKSIVTLPVRFVTRFFQSTENLVVGPVQGLEDIGPTAFFAARRSILFGMVLAGTFFFGGILWAGFARLDSAAHAMGEVISISRKRTINNPEGGIIKELLVVVGQEVKAGDVLMIFDDTKIRTEFHSVLNQLRSAIATESRLNAETTGATHIEYNDFLLSDRTDPEILKIIKSNDELFTSKASAIKAESESYQRRINQCKNLIESSEAKKKSLQNSLQLAKHKFDSAKRLNEKNFVHTVQVSELEERMTQIKTEITMTEHEIARLTEQTQEYEQLLINLSSKSLASALTELKEIQSRIPQLRELHKELLGKLARTIVRADVDGVVNRVEYTTVGSAVQPYALLFEFSPYGNLVVEATIDPRHISQVVKGLKCRIRFPAFKSRTTPEFSGEVISVSPDTTLENRGGRFQGTVYKAIITIKRKDFDRKAIPRGLVLKAGMPAEVVIVQGERTLLEYLLGPIKDALFRGMKER